MKVVSLSLDPRVLDINSAVSARNRLYGEIVEKYTVIIHDRKDSIMELTDSVKVYGVGGRFKFIRAFRIALLLRRLVREGSCDVISSSDPYFLSLLAYVIARKYHIGFDVNILGFENINSLRKRIATFIVKRAGSIRVNSTRLRDRVAEEFGISWSEIIFIPIYVAINDLGLRGFTPGSVGEKKQNEFKQEFKRVYDNRYTILSVGRLIESKDISMQLRAVAKLAEAKPDVMLHIVGEGVLRDTLEAEVLALGINKNVIFHGYLERSVLGVLYLLSDCFVYTSRNEGWPQVIFEAMNAGLPIVMTEAGCAGDLIKHEKNGLVVPVGDADALSKELLRVISDQKLSENLLKNTAIHLENYWTKEQILAGYKQSWSKAYSNAI